MVLAAVMNVGLASRPGVFYTDCIPRKWREMSSGCLYPIPRLHLTPICCVKVTGLLLLALSLCCHNCWQVRPVGPRSKSLLGLQVHLFLCQLSHILFYTAPLQERWHLIQGSSNLKWSLYVYEVVCSVSRSRSALCGHPYKCLLPWHCRVTPEGFEPEYPAD